jgi:hypothetical protein
MTYNIYYSALSGQNILGINEAKVLKIVDAYKTGKLKFTISGKQYSFKELRSLQIFTHEIEMSPNEFEESIKKSGLADRNLLGTYLGPKNLLRAGKNVTDDFIGDLEFGEEREKIKQTIIENATDFVNQKRIKELNSIDSEDFDLKKLIKFCNELNDNYSNGNYFSVAMLGRSIINHVPPVFGFTKFNEVTNNYGGKSFKASMNHLNVSMKNIADNFLHETVRKKEILPNSTQVNFSQDLDVLLAELVRVLQKKN